MGSHELNICSAKMIKDINERKNKTFLSVNTLNSIFEVVLEMVTYKGYVL